MDSRTEAAEAFVKAMRTTESSAVAWAARHIAADVVFSMGRTEIAGSDEVTAWLSKQWPFTPVYLQASWSAPRADVEAVTVHGEVTLLGAAPRSIDLRFSFNGADQIVRVALTQEIPPLTDTAATIPVVVRGLVNAALANGTPMVLAYIGEDGAPHQALRGSTQVYSDHQLCIWVRPGSNLPRAVQQNPRVSLLYRDSKTRTTLIIQGRGHIETDPAVRDRVYNLAPEVEQTHDPDRRGHALIVDVERLQGTHPSGPIRMERTL